MSQVLWSLVGTFALLTIFADALTTLVEFYTVQDQETMHPHIIALQSVRDSAKGPRCAFTSIILGISTDLTGEWNKTLPFTRGG